MLLPKIDNTILDRIKNLKLTKLFQNQEEFS